MIPMGDNRSRPAQWAVLAYDITCPRRAEAVRAALAPHGCHRQYSVWETRMPRSWVYDLLSELRAELDLDQDCLALWWPRRGARLALARNSTELRKPDGGVEPATLARHCKTLGGAGSFLISYDIGEPRRLRAIHSLVVAGGVMVQRSVYQWRCSVSVLERLLDACRALLDAGDRFWIHPLQGAGDLWRVGEAQCSVLPISLRHGGG